jgi:hypothetical protein
MSSFNNLLSRASILLEMAKGGKGEKNIKKNLPSPIYNVFKTASNTAKLKGGTPTREGRIAAITYIKDYIAMQIDLDISDEQELMRFINVPGQEPFIDFLEATTPEGSNLTYSEMLKNITDEDIEAINAERQRKVEDAVSVSMNRGEERQQKYDIRAAEIALRLKEKEEFRQMAQTAREKGDQELEGVMDAIGSGLEDAVVALKQEAEIKTVKDSANDVLDRLEDEIMSAPRGEFSPLIYKALANVRKVIENQITTVDQLKSLINKIEKEQGYQEIAYALSAAVRGIKLTRGGAVEEEEHDWRPESIEEYEPDYDEVMGGEEEEHDWRPESIEEYPPYNEIDNEEIINVVGYPHIVRYGDSGEVISVTTKEPGSEINVGLVNKYLQSGFNLSRAIAAATSYPSDTNTGNEDAMMMGESYTSMYLTEQIKKDSLYKPSKEETITFKNKYKPKTHWQLEELRRYGL